MLLCMLTPTETAKQSFPPPSPTDQGVLTRELLSLPLHSDTLRVRERRSELETRLAEIDDAIKIFSRPKVFVKLDE